MASVTGSLFVDLFLALLLVLYLVYWYFTNNDEYWTKRGVACVKKGIFIKSILGKQSQADAVIELYNQFSGEKFVGLFQFKEPVLMVLDPQLINKVLVKDFTHFQDRGGPVIKKDAFSKNLFGLRGRMWRAMRYKLTPTFTTGKLKGMFEQISKSGDSMIERINEFSDTKKDSVVDPKTFLFEFTLDVIASCAFGVQLQSGGPDFNKFKSFVEQMFSFSFLKFLKISFIVSLPKLADYLNVTFTPKEATEYFTNLTRATIKYRKENNVQRNDYFQLLLTLKEQEDSGKDMSLAVSHTTEEDAVIDQMQYTEVENQSLETPEKLFTEDAISSNTVIFLSGGSETVSRTISFVLFELSRHPEIQHRLQQEVDSVYNKHGSWSYEAIRDMTYLDQVVQESQRLNPFLPILSRECIRPYKVPDSDVVIEKGVQILIPVIGLHKDPQYYPDPDQFRPERFEGNNFKPSSTFLPFGDGPRICIAMRFAVMEVKTCVARIMSQYTLKLSDKTKVPLEYDPRSFIPSVKNGIWLSFEKRINNATL